MGWAHLQIQPITNSNRKMAVPLSAVKSSASINLYESKGIIYFSFFKVFHDGWMAIRISLPLRNWISFLGKPECEETSINSNSQYKQVLRDTARTQIVQSSSFYPHETLVFDATDRSSICRIYVTFVLSIRLSCQYVGCLSLWRRVYTRKVSFRNCVYIRPDEALTLETLA